MTLTVRNVLSFGVNEQSVNVVRMAVHSHYQTREEKKVPSKMLKFVLFCFVLFCLFVCLN